MSCRALPLWQTIVSTVVSIYSQIAILGATSIFSVFLFGLIFNHSVEAAREQDVSLVIDAFLHKCLLTTTLDHNQVSLAERSAVELNYQSPP